MSRVSKSFRASRSTTRAVSLEEMDLDAILARRPDLVLVDELAHTNAEGSRHPKRYLDVKELLDRGIDVYTTLNIQHVESLNDVVSQITRIRVRETVPDSIIDLADDVEIIDLTPDDLIKRLHDGKVYVAEDGRAGADQLFHRRQSDGAARTGAPTDRPARRRPAADPYAGERDFRPLGGRRTRAGLDRSSSALLPRSCAMRRAWPRGCALPGRPSISKTTARSI